MGPKKEKGSTPPTMPPACSIQDPRSNAPETLYKLLYLRAVRGSLLARSNNGPPLRRRSYRKLLHRSFSPSLLFTTTNFLFSTTWGSLSSNEVSAHRPTGE